MIDPKRLKLKQQHRRQLEAVSIRMMSYFPILIFTMMGLILGLDKSVTFDIAMMFTATVAFTVNIDVISLARRRAWQIMDRMERNTFTTKDVMQLRKASIEFAIQLSFAVVSILAWFLMAMIFVSGLTQFAQFSDINTKPIYSFLGGFSFVISLYQTYFYSFIPTDVRDDEAETGASAA